MRLAPTLLVLCLPLPLLAGCPSDEPADDGAASSTTSDDPTAGHDTASTTQTNPPLDTDTDPTPPLDTDTDPTPLDTDTDTDTDTTETGDPLTGCECILEEDHPGEPTTPASPLCGEPLCADVAAGCGGARCGGEGRPFAIDDPAALECALTALRDRTPGIVTWSWSELGGQYDDAGYVLVNADGTAVRRRWGWDDLDYAAGDAVLGALPPPEHFDACLAEADDVARFDCLRGALDSTREVCDDGWTHSEI